MPMPSIEIGSRATRPESAKTGAPGTDRTSRYGRSTTAGSHPAGRHGRRPVVIKHFDPPPGNEVHDHDEAQGPTGTGSDADAAACSTGADSASVNA